MLSNDVIATNIEALGNLQLLQSLLNNIQTNLSLIAEGAQGKIIDVINPNLYQLAAQYYGDATEWTTIANANGITDPIFTGGSLYQVKVTNSGVGYVSPTINFLGDEIIPAYVIPIVFGGGIAEIFVIAGGLYGTAPVVQINDPAGNGATALAFCSAKLIIPQTSTPSGGLLNLT